MESKNSYKKGGMFEGVLPLVYENAKKNRNQPTAAETVFWMHLKEGIESCKFRRQHPIGMYIADFYCHKAAVIIEVDGSIHHTKEVKKADEEKEVFLTTRSYTVLRFTNDEVMHELETVLQKITKTINNNIRKHSPHSGVKSPL